MSAPKAAELPVFVLWMEFLKWLLPTTEKFPKHVRFSLANRIDMLALDVVEDLIEARFTKNKGEILNRANLRLEKLRILLRISSDARHLSQARFRYAAERLDEAGRMLGGWMKQQEASR